MNASTLLFREGRVSRVSELYALQEIDLALDADRAAIEDAASRLDEPEGLANARVVQAERQEALHAAERLYKDQEYEADQVMAKIQPLEKKLYQGNVVNPKELQDLQHDIDSLKRHRSDLDAQALSAMERLEAAQAAHAEAEQELARIAAEHGADVQDATSRSSRLEEEVAELERQRAEQAATIEAPLLQLYGRLLEGRQRGAVAKVVGGACQGCRISLPMNLIQRARGGNDIVQCSSCERILYVM